MLQRRGHARLAGILQAGHQGGVRADLGAQVGGKRLDAGRLSLLRQGDREGADACGGEIVQPARKHLGGDKVRLVHDVHELETTALASLLLEPRVPEARRIARVDNVEQGLDIARLLQERVERLSVEHHLDLRLCVCHGLFVLGVRVIGAGFLRGLLIASYLDILTAHTRLPLRELLLLGNAALLLNVIEQLLFVGKEVGYARVLALPGLPLRIPLRLAALLAPVLRHLLVDLRTLLERLPLGRLLPHADHPGHWRRCKSPPHFLKFFLACHVLLPLVRAQRRRLFSKVSMPHLLPGAGEDRVLVLPGRGAAGTFVISSTLREGGERDSPPHFLKFFLACHVLLPLVRAQRRRLFSKVSMPHLLPGAGEDRVLVLPGRGAAGTFVISSTLREGGERDSPPHWTLRVLLEPGDEEGLAQWWLGSWDAAQLAELEVRSASECGSSVSNCTEKLGREELTLCVCGRVLDTRAAGHLAGRGRRLRRRGHCAFAPQAATCRDTGCAAAARDGAMRATGTHSERSKLN